MSSRAVVLFLACVSAVPAAAQMRVERFDTPPTANEIASFKAYILTVAPGTNGNLNPQNDWVQHNSGQRTKAMGLMYEMTRDVAILDRMITFCDAVLSQRNKDFKLSGEKLAPAMGRFYYDVTQSLSAPTYAALRALVPPDRLLFGSDCPFAKEPQVRAVLAELDRLDMPPAERAGLERGNALSLFPRLV